MRFDSVFDLPISFPDDRPLIPISAITDALDQIEADGVAAMEATISVQWLILIRDGMALVEARDILGVQALKWNLAVPLQQSIYGIWQAGWVAGNDHAIAEIIAGVPEGRFTTPRQEISRLIQVAPNSLENSGAVRDVQQRILRLSGDFSKDQIAAVRRHLTAAIAPDSSGKVLSRAELETTLANTLKVSMKRAEAIARTELTNAYNTSRLETMLSSSMVTHVRFLAISDARTTAICRSRNGMLISVADKGAIAANKPPLHVRCRSVVSPVMANLNPVHREWAADPGRSYQNRKLGSLPPGWGDQPRKGLPTLPPLTEVNLETLIERGKAVAGEVMDRFEAELAEIAAKNAEALAVISQRYKILQAKFGDRLEDELRRIDPDPDVFEWRELATEAFDSEVRAKNKAYKIFEQFQKDFKANGLSQSDALDLLDSVEFVPNPKIADLGAVKLAIADTLRLSGGRGASRLKLVGYYEDRAWADKSGTLNIGESLHVRTLAHEIGHFVEDESKEVRQAASDFIHRRASGAPKKLSAMTGIDYEDDEIALPDRFWDPYVGKVYAEGSTEVVSMGLENFVDPIKLREFYMADKEHFFFTVGVLRR
jgi:SPP1 gp7 family putative phage head morphogenesis protein